MQWFVLGEQGSSLVPGEMGECGWAGYIPVEEGRSAGAKEADDSYVGSERQNSDCIGERVGVCWPAGRSTAGAMAGETAGEKGWEMVCIAGTAGSAEHTPGPQRSGPVGQRARTSANGRRKPLC